MGGLVLADYAGRHPGQVAGLLLDDPAGDLTRLPRPALDAWLDGFGLDTYPAFREQWFGKMLEPARPAVREAVLARMRATPREVVAASARGLCAYDPTPGLRGYRGPSLTVVTEQNNEPYSLQNVVPGLRSQLVPGTSHWIMMDDPEAFNAVLDRFLAEVK